MKVVTVDSDEDGWDSFVDSAKDATVYHRFGWKEIIKKSFGHNCYYLAAIGNNKTWQGILPLVHMRSRLFGSFLISVPFVNYGGLLCNDEATGQLLLSEADQLRRLLKATHVELRHLRGTLDGLPTRQHKVTMILDLATDEERQWQSFNAKLRNQIRKAQKSRLSPIVGHLELLDGFYDVFARNMRDLGTPVYGKAFFRNVLEAFPDTSRIFAVYHENVMIAAGIGSWFRGTLEMPWASSINEYKALCPNNMLYWEAIRFAIGKRLSKFDFGRSTPHEGTYNFKKQWGAVPIQLNWQYLLDEQAEIPHLNPSNPKYRSAIQVWQRLPVTLTKIFGPLIVRNIP
jgi:FemAB-related protein (PEP-CTERM system-associated)